jgi:hypothetical protein
MEFMLDFAGVGGAIALSIVFALGVEYASLRGLLRLMPSKVAGPAIVGATPERNGRARDKAA